MIFLVEIIGNVNCIKEESETFIRICDCINLFIKKYIKYILENIFHVAPK